MDDCFFFLKQYKNRLNDIMFNDVSGNICSGVSCSDKNEKCASRVELKNGCGFVSRRTRTQPAVIHYASQRQRVQRSFIKVSSSCSFHIELI